MEELAEAINRLTILLEKEIASHINTKSDLIQEKYTTLMLRQELENYKKAGNK